MANTFLLSPPRGRAFAACAPSSIRLCCRTHKSEQNFVFKSHEKLFYPIFFFLLPDDCCRCCCLYIVVYTFFFEDKANGRSFPLFSYPGADRKPRVCVQFSVSFFSPILLSSVERQIFLFEWRNYGLWPNAFIFITQVLAIIGVCLAVNDAQ